MPLKKKKNLSVKTILIIAGILILVILMLISFSAPQHMTEVVLISQ